MRPINTIIIHCSATRPEWMQFHSLWSKRMEIKRWHVEDNGWSDIGYHVLIDRDGTYTNGRPFAKTGAHTMGHNRGSIGICLIGGHGGAATDAFDKHYTSKQEETLRELIAEYEEIFGKLRVYGHNDFAAKACPCFPVGEWY